MEEQLIKEYLDGIYGNKKLNIEEKELLYELESHIWEIYYESIEQGMSKEDAITDAIKQLGDSKTINLNLKHKDTFNYSFMFWVSISIILILGSRVSIYYISGKEFNSVELLQSILMLVGGFGFVSFFRFFKYEIFLKKPFTIWGVMLLIDWCITVLLLEIKGNISINYKALITFFYLWLGGFLLCNYEKMTLKQKKILPFFMVGTIVVSGINNRKVTLGLVLLGYFIIILMNNRKETYIVVKKILGIWGVGLLLVCTPILIWGKDYQKIRMLTFFSLEKDTPIVSIQNQARNILISSKVIGETEMWDNEVLAMDSYFISNIAGNFGLIIVFLILMLYGIQIIILNRRIAMYPQERKIGYMFVGLYFFRIFYSLGMNWGVLPATSIELPFCSLDVYMYLFDCMHIGYLANTFLYRRRFQGKIIELKGEIM